MTETRQQIRFCASDDGTRIAYATTGQGPPLVRTANWLTHLEHDWTNPVSRPALTEFSRNNTFIRYDLRGCGLSDRNVEDMSFEAWVKDLEAVVDAAELDRFSLVGISQGAAIAIAYAARHPERVSRLLLHGSYVRGIRTLNLKPELIDRLNTMVHLLELGWGTKNPAFRQIFSSLLIPGGSAEQWGWWNELQRVSSSGTNAARALGVMHWLDVRALAGQISCPTLVTHSREDTCVPFAEGRLTASLISHARLVTIESRNHFLIEGDPAWQRFVEEFREFMGAEMVPGARNSAQEEFSELSPREREVLDLIARGMDNDQIAARLELSQKTVRNHITSIFAKIEVYTRAKAIVVAREAGLGLTQLK